MIRRRCWAIVAGVAVTAGLGGVGWVAATARHRPGDPITDAAQQLSLAAPAPAPVVASMDAAPAPSSSVPPATATRTPVPTATKPVTHRKKAKPRPETAAKPVAKPARTTSGSGGNSGTGRIRYGQTYTGNGTFYAATGAGNCSYPASSDLMVGAMNQQDYDNSRACGAYLAVTGPRGTTITIKVVDRCPGCPPGAIDLSQQAFARLAPTSAGLIRISWRLLSPALSGPVAYKYKTGSSRYWCGIQVLDHRNPVAALAVKVGGGWKSLPRMDYNYFVSATGAGCGGPLRITDIYGHQLTDSGIALSPDAVQRGHAQFGPPL